MKKILALVMAAFMMAACFAGCAPKENAGGSSNTADTEKVMTIGYTLYEPMNYKDADGKLIGFDTELAEAVCKKLGYTPVFKLIDWNNKYVDVNAGTIDCIWNGFTANTKDDDGVARADKVDFSYNYMGNKQVVVVKDAAITKAADLSGKIGAAEKGSAGETYAKGFGGATIKGVTYQTDALMEVNSGTAQFAVLDEQLAKSMCGKGDYANLKIVDGIASEAEYYAIGFKKGSELTALVNGALEALAADGTISALAQKYDVVNTTVVDFSDQKAGAVDEK